METNKIDFRIFYKKMEEMEKFLQEANEMELRNFCLDNWKDENNSRSTKNSAG